MKKLTILPLVILVLASLICPSAVIAGGAEVHADQSNLEPLNFYQKDHLKLGLDTDGSLSKSIYGLMGSTSEPRSIAGQKLVCLTFDDGWENQYNNALPILQQYGLKATFAVVTTWIGNGSGAGKAMSMDEIHQLANQGMDIASHSRTHAHLPTLDANSLQSEVAGSKTELETAGFNIRTLVYPYFEYNGTVVTSVKNAGYICARSGALNSPYDPTSNTDSNARYYVDAIEINTQDLTTFKSIVDIASDHSVICLCYHSISDDTAAPTPRTPVANFSEQMRYLKEGGFSVILLPDLIQSPWIAFSPASMTFSGVQGGSNPVVQTVNITNSSGGTLNWTASSNAAWLSLAPTSGAAPSAVTVTASITGLSAGSYNGAITITATGATNTPQTVPVTLTVQTPSSGWLTGWSYRKQITIAGSTAGAQMNYPMKFAVNRSTGTDSGSTVYLGTKCASDYKDIRFTKTDGATLLDYWIESSDSNTATVWVEFDSIPASPATATFNLYYGNSAATSSSNIKTTFVFGDDFEDGALDAARWATGGGTGGSVTEANGVLTVTAGSSNQKYAASISTYSNGYALHTRAKLDSITSCSSYRLIGFVTTKGSYADKLFTTSYRWYYGDTTFYAISGNGSSASQANMNMAKDTNYHISECRRYAVSGTNYDRFIIDGGSAVSGAYPTATSRYIYINTDEPGKAIIVDWIFLRKFVSPEPAWGAWGIEEISGSPPSPTIAFNPASLTFSGIQGGSNPATQTLNISNSGGGTLNWTASSNAAWLSLAPTSGTALSAVTVTASITGLSAGTYNGTITITATGATNTPQVVPVTLTVQTPPSPTIAFSPASLTFSGIQGGSNPATQILNITNSGSGTLNWTASSNAAWLSLAPTSGAAPGTVTVTASITGLSAGSYNGTITITATGATNTPQTVPVTLTVQTPSSGWLTGWSYRKQITIAGSTAGAQTNYPMKFAVNRSTGTDSGSTVYLGTKCASDYKDIRFTKADGTTPLDYWIESSDSNTATIWVEFDSIPASPATATFNLYYGNSAATSSSNIKNTFVFGDDFEDGSLDAARWSTGGGTGGSVTEANGVLTVTAGSSNQKYAASINTYSNGYALHTRAKLDSITSCSSYRLIGFVTTKGSYADKLFTTSYRWYYGDTTFYAISGNGSSASQANMNVAKDTNYHISECRRYAVSGTNYDRFIIDGGTAVIGTKPTATSRYIYINSDEPGKAIIVDWIFLRKFVSPEPAWGAWGSEQTY